MAIVLNDSEDNDCAAALEAEDLPRHRYLSTVTSNVPSYRNPQIGGRD